MNDKAVISLIKQENKQKISISRSAVVYGWRRKTGDQLS